MVFFYRMFCFFVLWTNISSFYCETRHIYFGLKDTDGADHVIMTGETNIRITCNVSCVQNAEIQILFGELVLVHNSYTGNYIDYTINEITAVDYSYRCLVRYSVSEPLQGPTEKWENATFSPLVLNDVEHITCRRNGTSSAPYKVGDWLSLQCFCRFEVTGPCQWLRVIPGGLPTVLPSTSSTSTNGIIEMVEASSGRLEEGDDEIVFYCSPVVSQTPNRPSCVIGPMLHSGRDRVLSSHQIPSYTGCRQLNDFTTEHFMTSSSYDEKYHPSTNIIKHENEAPDQSNQVFLEFEIIILIIVGIISTIIIILIVVVVVCLFRNLTVSKDKPQGVKEIGKYDHNSTKMQENISTEADHDYDTPPFITGETDTGAQPFYESPGTGNILERGEDGYTFINKKRP